MPVFHLRKYIIFLCLYISKCLIALPSSTSMPATSQQRDDIDGYAEDNMLLVNVLLSCLASRFGWWSTENESYASSPLLYSNLNSHSGMGALLNTYIMLINQKCFRYCTVNEQWMPITDIERLKAVAWDCSLTVNHFRWLYCYTFYVWVKT